MYQWLTAVLVAAAAFGFGFFQGERYGESEALRDLEPTQVDVEMKELYSQYVKSNSERIEMCGRVLTALEIDPLEHFDSCELDPDCAIGYDPGPDDR